MDQQPRQVTLDLDNVQSLVNFSSEVLVRLAFFSTAKELSQEQRTEAAHKYLDALSGFLHDHLNERTEAFHKEHDDAGTAVPGRDLPDHPAEQVGH